MLIHVDSFQAHMLMQVENFKESLGVIENPGTPSRQAQI